MIYNSSDSEDEVFVQADQVSVPFSTVEVKHFAFVHELPSVPVHVLSLTASQETISQHTAILRRSISAAFPFIAIGYCQDLHGLVISTHEIVLFLYIDTSSLPPDVEDLLLSPDLTRVTFSNNHLPRLNKFFHITIPSSVEIQHYFKQIGLILENKYGKCHSLGKPGSPSSVFSAHGYSLTPTSHATTTEEILYNEALSVFCTAFHYHLKLTKGIKMAPISLTQPCHFLSTTSPHAALQLSLTESFAFQHTVLLGTQAGNSSWMADVVPFCCDLHNLNDPLTLTCFLVTGDAKTAAGMEQCLIPFALFVHRFVSYPANSFFFQFFGYSNVLSFVKRCLSALLDGIESLSPNVRVRKVQILLLLKDLNNYRNLLLLFLHNLFVLTLSIDSSKVQHMVVTQSMFNLPDDFPVIRPYLQTVVKPFVSEVFPSKKSKQKAKNKAKKAKKKATVELRADQNTVNPSQPSAPVSKEETKERS
ncbi:hypothetical protein GEMRC1_002312 [Eukaryota sp. GEM-RC1]